MSALDDFIELVQRIQPSPHNPIRMAADMAAKEVAGLRSALEFHPRAAKLMRKQKNFLVVAIDEPYFADVYNLIRDNEKKKGTWTSEDEQLWRDALLRVGVDPDRITV